MAFFVSHFNVILFCFYVSICPIISHEGTNVSRSLAAVGDFWSTSGGSIVNSKGVRVYFSGVNWGGFESSNCIVDGLWGGTGRTIKSHLQQMSSLGFNVIRLAFSGTCVQKSSRPRSTAVDYKLNKDLVGLSSVQVIQKIVSFAGQFGIRVILDYHRRTPTGKKGLPEDGLWFSATHPESYWIATWQNLARQFKGNPTVIGVDLFNEPHNGKQHPGPFWSYDGNDKYNWRRAAKKAGDAIHSIEPRWLIFVQGMWDGAWWGANLRSMKSIPLKLKVSNKLVYQVHDYGPSLHPQWWFNDNFPNGLYPYWYNTWGFIKSEGVAPVFIGEFGSLHNLTMSTNPKSLNWKELQWFNSLIGYINTNCYSWTYFTWGPNSWDTGGILKNDWRTVHEGKVKKLKSIFHKSFKCT